MRGSPRFRANMLVWFCRFLSIDDFRVLRVRGKRGASDVERVKDLRFAPINLYKRQILEAVGGHKEPLDYAMEGAFKCRLRPVTGHPIVRDVRRSSAIPDI